MVMLSTEENVAILKAVLQGGAQARQAALDAFQVFEKGHEDYVTNVDRELDRFFAGAFSAQFPGDGVITEENQASARAFLLDHARLWFIDPIDGTEDFINRGQHYSVMVGLLMEHQPRAGWVYAPAQERLYWGGPDWGLFQRTEQGETVPLVPKPLAWGESDVVLLGDRDRRRFECEITHQLPQLTFDSVGSFGLKVLEVIKGRAGLYAYFNGRVKLWDTTGPIALAQAAGLTCCDLDGQPIRFDPASIYPASLIHRQPIIIGWPDYLDKLLPPLRKAVVKVRCRELLL